MMTLRLPDKIQVILGSKMKNKDKIDAITELIASEFSEKYIQLNIKKIRQQIMSEVLYLFEKIEENEEINKNYIRRRINLARQNCINWMVRSWQDENLQGNQIFVVKDSEEERNADWHAKTWRRYERFYLGHDIEVEKKQKRQPARPKLPLNLTPNKEVE